MTSSTNQGSQPEIFYSEDTFDYGKFKDVYVQDNTDLTQYRHRCSKNRDLRKNRWYGKTDDLKKGSEDAFPHKGASDTEVYAIDKAIQNYVAMCMNALQRSKIMAYPREASDAERSGEVSAFLRWMRDTGVKNFNREMELAASYGAEKGIMATYCGSQSKRRPVLKRYDIDDILDTLPELEPVMQMQQVEFIELVTDEERVEEVIELFDAVEEWEINPKRVKKALKQLRTKGFADIPFIEPNDWSFDARTQAPDADFILPVHTMNPEDSPRMHMRMLLTGQDLQSAAATEGWDQEWVDYMIQNHTGMSTSKFTSPYGENSYLAGSNGDSITYYSAGDSRDLIEVVYTYERLIEEEDGSEGYYITVWSPESGDNNPGVPAYGKRELLSGRKSFPFVITPLTFEAKTLYDSTTYPELLKAAQKTKKVLRDGYIDEQEWSVSPAMYAPPGVDISQFGPGMRGNGPVGRKPEFIEKPSNFAPNINLDQIITDEANQHIGQDPNDPFSQIRNQHEINKFLIHAQNVLAKLYEEFKLRGPDELFFRVSGSREPQAFIKNEDEAEMDIKVAFNTMHDDPDWLEKTSQVVNTLRQNDPSGLIDSDKVNLWILSSIDPMLAEMVTSPEAQGSAKIVQETTDDIAKMAAGMEVGAPQNAAQARLQVVMDYYQSPKGQATLQQNIAFQDSLTQYAEQLQFQIQQSQNAVIGRIGTQPAQMGGTSTQTANAANG